MPQASDLLRSHGQGRPTTQFAHIDVIMQSPRSIVDLQAQGDRLMSLSSVVLLLLFRVTLAYRREPHYVYLSYICSSLNPGLTGFLLSYYPFLLRRFMSPISLFRFLDRRESFFNASIAHASSRSEPMVNSCASPRHSLCNDAARSK